MAPGAGRFLETLDFVYAVGISVRGAGEALKAFEKIDSQGFAVRVVIDNGRADGVEWVFKIDQVLF